MAILLDILRHGYAVPMDGSGDRGRRLSPQGLAELGRLAQELSREGWRPDRIFSSPFLRATETAAFLSRAAGGTVPVEILEALEPDGDPPGVLRALAFRGIAEGHVLIVGHQPLLGRLVAHLTGSERGLAPGSLVRVECPAGMEPGNGTVVRTIRPAEPGGA